MANRYSIDPEESSLELELFKGNELVLPDSLCVLHPEPHHDAGEKKLSPQH